MAQKILIKRSATPAKIPLVGDVDLGEIALNTNDGKLFIKKNNGVESIVEIGGITVSGDASGVASGGLLTLTLGTVPVLKGGTGVTTSTGTGSVVLSTSPTLTTPALGVATGTSFNLITALSSSLPAPLGVATIGTSTTVARSDHIHLLPTPATLGAQPVDADLTAISALSTTGIVRRTAANTWSAGTLVGLTSEVTGALPVLNGGTGQTTLQLAINSLTGGVANAQFLRGNGTNVVMSAIQASDVPTLNQNTTGSAATLTTPRTINSVSFNGSANITINAVDSTARVASSLLGAPNGVATLDAGGLVPSTQLPSYVDDVLEYVNLVSFPATGETGKIYIALDTNKTYRWSGTVYVYITSGAVDSVAGKTGIVTLVKGDVGLGSVDNTSDADKPVSTAQSNAIGLKANIASPVFTGNVTGLGVSTGTSFNAITALSSSLPAALGTATIGVSTTVARSDHVHLNPTLDSLSNTTITANSTGEILKWNGSAWINNTLAEAGIQAAGTYATGTGSASGTNTGDNATNTLYSGLVSNVTTNLSTTTTATTVTINSSDGTNAIIPAATTTVAGVLTGADKLRLDGMATGATANTGTVTGVNTGNGMNFANFTTSGTITLGTPSSLTSATTNAVTASSHTHAITGFSLDNHNHTLDGLSNTTITANSTGEILKWNGSAWINNTLAEAGIQPTGSYATLAGVEALTNKTLATGSTLIAGATISIGDTTSTASTTPLVLSLGGTHSSVAGANPKFKLYESGATVFGFGISNSQMDYIVPSAMTHNFYVNAVKIMGVSGAAGAGNFNNTATTPTGTTRLNWDGYFYPTFLNLIGSADTATAATHYFVETGSDGYVRPKTLANVQSEIVTTATVNSAAATTVGTLTAMTTTGIAAAPTFRSSAVASSGFGLWNSTPITYGILMSASTDGTYGGRISGETTSDYNMYFTMANVTNRGFVFRTSYASQIFAINPNGVRSNVDVTIAGALYATSKSFKIDHPTKPKMHLVHGSLEGPEHGVYCRGRLTNDNMIELPEYWTELIDESTITVNLTAIGRGQQLYVESIEDNMVFVGNDNLINKKINCFYTVFAERKDISKLVVEV